MKTKDLIKQTIKDIFLWSSDDSDGLEVAQVILVLDNGKMTSIPWGADDIIQLTEIPKEACSLFAFSARKMKQQESFLTLLKGQRFIDFIQYDDPDSAGFLLLENGVVITEIGMAPYGTGLAGLHVYNSLALFEEECGEGYTRFFSEK